MLLQRAHFLTLEFTEKCQATHIEAGIHVFDMCAQCPFYEILPPKRYILTPTHRMLQRC